MSTNQADEAQATETENVQDLAPDSDEGDESLWSERALDTAIDEFLDAIPLEERPGSLPLKILMRRMTFVWLRCYRSRPLYDTPALINTC